MKFGVLGTGMVGRAIASKLVQIGHEVMMGSRAAGGEAAVAWAQAAGPLAQEGSFADAAGFGELIVNATAGTRSIDALTAAGEDRLAGKVLIDIANPLDFSSGAPTLSICNTDSLAERIQRTFPAARVVKTLNTVNAEVMVQPDLVAGAHAIFVSGDDADAKRAVVGLLEDFGWPADSIIDLGDIATARGTEMYLPLWLRLWGTLNTGHFNISIQRPA